MNFRKSLENADVIDIDGYKYFIHPFTDGVIPIHQEELWDLAVEVCDIMLKEIKDYSKCNLFVTPEALGIPITTLISHNTNIPYVIVRKRPYGLPNEKAFNQRTGYGGSWMYINGVEPGDRIIIIDDILSTGGTLSSLIKALQEMNVIVLAAVVLVDKGNKLEKISNKFNVPIIALEKIEIIDEKVMIK